MRFLLLNQFYPPDPAPTGWYLHGLARELARRGHEVKVLCSRRAYDGKNSFPPRQMMEGVAVARLPATGFGRRGFAGKIADYGSFYVSLATALLLDGSRPDLILSLTTPPYIGLLAKAAAARRGGRHAHWIMDLYPDVMFADRPARRDGAVFRLLRNLTRWQWRGAETVLSLGAKMAEKVAVYIDKGAAGADLDTATIATRLPIRSPHDEGVGRGEILWEPPHPGPLLHKYVEERETDCSSPVSTYARAAAWIPLWSDPDISPWPEEETNPLRVERGWNAGEVVFLYSGNMGVGHRFGEFLEAARQLGASGPRWAFGGGGKRRGEIEAFARNHPTARIEFLDYAPQSRLAAHLGAADVHLASLEPAWQGLMVPSKIQASFAAARPVLFVGGRQCETSDWIQESGGGWIVEPGDMAGLLKAIEQCLEPGERGRRGRMALEFARRNFRMSENCAGIARLLEGRAVSPPLTSPVARGKNSAAEPEQQLSPVL